MGMGLWDITKQDKKIIPNHFNLLLISDCDIGPQKKISSYTSTLLIIQYKNHFLYKVKVKVFFLAKNILKCIHFRIFNTWTTIFLQDHTVPNGFDLSSLPSIADMGSQEGFNGSKNVSILKTVVGCQECLNIVWNCDWRHSIIIIRAYHYLKWMYGRVSEGSQKYIYSMFGLS